MASVKPKKGSGYPVIWIVTFNKVPSDAELRAKKAILRKITKADVINKVNKKKASPGFEIQMTWLRDGRDRKIYYVLVNVFNPRKKGGGTVVTPTPPSPPTPKI